MILGKKYFILNYGACCVWRTRGLFFSHRARAERDIFDLVIDVKIKLKICYSWATLVAAADSRDLHIVQWVMTTHKMHRRLNFTQNNADYAFIHSASGSICRMCRESHCELLRWMWWFTLNKGELNIHRVFFKEKKHTHTCLQLTVEKRTSGDVRRKCNRYSKAHLLARALGTRHCLSAFLLD